MRSQWPMRRPRASIHDALETVALFVVVLALITVAVMA